MDLAISNLEITGNEFVLNQLNNINIKQVHQKSNKFKFLMFDNKCKQSEKGYGLNIYDSGMKIENCLFQDNKEGGVYA